MNNSLQQAINRVMVDTSGYFALTDTRDPNHQRAAAILATISKLNPQLFTTNLIVAELHALTLKRLGRDTALSLIRSIRASETNIIRISGEDEDRALDIITRYRDKEFSYTDAASFAVMERIGIQYAFSFDRHFKQYTFTALDDVV